jgi:hypothetical protein
MSKFIYVVVSCIFLMVVHTWASAQIADYPTVERILFVDECVRAHPQRHHQEMLYKCSCVLDKLAEDISFARYAELIASSNAYSIAGERGSAVRTEHVLSNVKEYRLRLSEAGNTCLLPR